MQDADAAPVHLLHGLDAHFELALVEHRHLRARLDAPGLGMPRGVDEPGDAGRDEMLVLVGFEHVERLFVGEGGVVDVLDAVAHALLDRSRGAGVGGKHLVAALAPRFTAMATSSSDIGVSSAPMPVISSPERLSLIESTPYLMSCARCGASLPARTRRCRS